ncbi:ATP-binding protein [Hydrogenophaga laconesensis]|uniref:Energy-coupling factor transporter ATP-binding protein EcfA2 n=1 Tax=Hydrogenophaga laconesensis TaxID=1805971 RepID=A0ABU1VFT4_9BURK|nr:ATP-binding protein [Hydrogenophaga laconesensis]MDR7096058.1 energy-coupling factor transporter ATP-binding protein EcfA2 [Hydrogenophaga laconesensis]
MKVDKLVLVNWGQMAPGDYPLGQMTLLLGETGAGKSTLLDALQALMTGYHKSLAVFNPAQDEVNQGAARSKTKRTMESYIVGAEGSKFSRPAGAQGYLAAVFHPDPGEVGARPFTAVSVSIVDVLAVRTAVGRPLRALSSLERWRQAVSDHLDAPDDVRIRVSDYPLDVAGHAPEDIVRRLAQLRGLGDSPLLLREVSSRLFWGMSKVLDGKQDLVCALLQAEECPFPESPIQLLAHLPVQAVRGYLFIENQATFERACRGGFEGLQGLVLLYSAGFKASAARLRRPEGSSLYLSDASPNTREVRAALRAWLYRDGPLEHTPVAFWGDLDWSGMQILASLRMSFPEAVAWEPGYRALLNVLEEGGGHLPAAADKTGQRVVASTGCSFADATLLPALARAGRFVDQEWADLASLRV